MNLSEAKDFPVSTASLKEVRIFSRETFEKINLSQDLKDELVLAIAEAAQNIVKHGYKGVEKIMFFYLLFLPVAFCSLLWSMANGSTQLFCATILITILYS